MRQSLTERSIQKKFERGMSLTPREKTILQLNTEENLGPTAIAARLNLRPKTACSVLKIARQKKESIDQFLKK